MSDPTPEAPRSAGFALLPAAVGLVVVGLGLDGASPLRRLLLALSIVLVAGWVVAAARNRRRDRP